ncbi:MAG: hypothetical protein KatS3mg109_0546 [Pirellulaceae bacterium]|nr:MAG: hypothetical protein KatS3mg109_0546 [Pirellulaceae bacterium]
MQGEAIRIDSLEDLRRYVHEMICQLNDLEPGRFSMTERILLRQHKPCGIYYCLHGPRNVKLTAIWETDRQTILFYGSDGQRQLRTQLVRHPVLVHRGDAQAVA